jgi:hypothetical protein
MRRLRALKVKEEETEGGRPVATIDVQTILTRDSYLPENKKSTQARGIFTQNTPTAPTGDNNSNYIKQPDRKLVSHKLSNDYSG